MLFIDLLNCSPSRETLASGVIPWETSKNFQNFKKGDLNHMKRQFLAVFFLHSPPRPCGFRIADAC